MARPQVAPDTLALQLQYQQIFGRPPPRKASREFMYGNLQYHAQAQQLGGMPPQMHVQLMGVQVSQQSRPTLATGLRLSKAWQGDVHEVQVTGPRQYIYRQQTYTSLSAIARHITGTRWNGHAFFGLKKAKAS